MQPIQSDNTMNGDELLLTSDDMKIPNQETNQKKRK